MPDPKNMGRAWSKVILYEKLPYLIVDPTKLRKSTNFVISLESETTIQKDSFGVQFLAVPGGKQGECQAAAAIPKMCYEPIDNWMYKSGITMSYSSVYWDKLDGSGAGGIPPLFKRLILTGSTSVVDSTTLPSTTPQQKWRDEELNVQTVPYNDTMYTNSGLGFDSSSHSGMGSLALGGASGSGSVIQPETRRFIHQHQTGAGCWWGAKMRRDYKAYGVPFWVTIRPAQGYTPDEDDKSKTSYLGILITRDSRRSSVQDSEYILVIDNRGHVFVVYAYGTSDIKTRFVSVNLPSLSLAFQNGDELRVGFLIVCGRLCIVANEFEYDFVNLWGANIKDIQRGFNLVEKKAEVYGYGCSAYINVSPMTFYRRSWFILGSMDGNVHYNGHRSPAVDSGGTSAGTWAGGALITWPIPKAQYDAAGGKEMYAGQFSYYKEIDQVDPGLTTYGTNTTSQVYTQQNNARNWWGQIYIVRSAPITNISSGKFWYCYMETTSPTYGSITNTGSGFPIFYNLFARRNQNTSGRPGTDMTSFSSTEITQYVTDIQITEELDATKPSAIIKKASVTIYDPEDSTDFNIYLTRARGIKIWLKWGTGSSNPNSTGDDELFVGVAFGQRAVMQPGKDTVTFTCFDYWKVLERMKIKNSPFYDGFELVSVIKDLAGKAGVTVHDNVHNGSTSVPFYFLGSGFSFDKPMHRYEAEMSIKDCMLKAIQAFPYYLHFADSGRLYISVVPGDFDFSQSGSGWDAGVQKTYYREFNSAIGSSHPEKLILNEVTMMSTLADSLFNSFLVRGVNRTTNQVITATASNSNSLTSPTSVGYLGFISEKDITQPALDSQEAVNTFLQRIRKMYATPGFETTIVTIGHRTGYRCGQFIKIKHNRITPSSSRKYRVTQIEHVYSAEKNEWLTKITAYQITPGRFNWTSTTP